jgi:hypothetical protein
MPCKSKCGGDADEGKAGKAGKPGKAAAGKTDVSTLEAYKALTAKFGKEIGVAELVSLAASATGIIDELKGPSASEKKSVEKLYQWFQNNWSKVSPELDNIDLEDEEEDDEGDDDE